MLCFDILFSLAYRMLQQIITLMLQDTILKQTFSSDVVCLTLKSRNTRPPFYIYDVGLFHSTLEPNSFSPRGSTLSQWSQRYGRVTEKGYMNQTCQTLSRFMPVCFT